MSNWIEIKIVDDDFRDFLVGVKKGFLTGTFLIALMLSAMIGAHVAKALDLQNKLFGSAAPVSVSKPAPASVSPQAVAKLKSADQKNTPTKTMSSPVASPPVTPPVIDSRSKDTAARHYSRDVRQEKANAIRVVAERFRDEIKASLNAFRKQLLMENSKLKARVRRLEQRTRRLERKLRRFTCRKKTVDARKAASYQHLAPTARILATIQIEGEWLAYLQLATGDKRRVHVGSKLGDLTVKDISPRRVVMETAKGQQIIMTISGV